MGTNEEADGSETSWTSVTLGDEVTPRWPAGIFSTTLTRFTVGLGIFAETFSDRDSGAGRGCRGGTGGSGVRVRVRVGSKPALCVVFGGTALTADGGR